MSNLRKASKPNSAQRTYMLAKAHLQTLREREIEIERAYIVSHDIRNADGTIPEQSCCIENMETFAQAAEAIAAEIDDCGLSNDILEAEDALIAAEDAMIADYISSFPVSVRPILERGVMTSPKSREIIIDRALRMDTSTVPGKPSDE